MNDKCLRDSRKYAQEFLREYQINPIQAKLNLQKRLEGKQKRTKDTTVETIKHNLPGIDL